MSKETERQKSIRDRNPNRPKRKLAPCGTWAAACRHRYHKEPLDAACLEAVSRHNAEQAERRRKSKNG